MRNPFRSEAEAFRFVLISVGLFAVVAVVGIVFGGWAALAAFVVLAAALAFYVKQEPPAQEHVAAGKERHPATPRHRSSAVGQTLVATSISSSKVRTDPAGTR